MKLKKRVAIITGASRGFGKACAIEMAKEGASLVILARTFYEIKETSKIIKDLGGKVLSFKADVSNKDDVERVIHKAITIFESIDILINNAAVIAPVKPLYEVDEKDWNSAININLKGVFLFSRAVIPHMIKKGRGKIINLTSGLGKTVKPPLSVYSISKAGVIHLTRILAAELKDYNIQVNGLDPGAMDTKMQNEIRSLGPEVLGNEIYNEFQSLKELSLLRPPEKSARLAVFLASDESNHITGRDGVEADYMRLGFKG